jgi:hypothetical protein
VTDAAASGGAVAAFTWAAIIPTTAPAIPATLAMRIDARSSPTITASPRGAGSRQRKWSV